jgi:hypothetical protein
MRQTLERIKAAAEAESESGTEGEAPIA